MRLRHKIALFAAMLVLVIVAAAVYVSSARMIAEAGKAMSSYAKMVAKTVAGKWISDFVEDPDGSQDTRLSLEDIDSLQRFIAVLMSLDDRLAAVVVSGKNGTVLAGDINPRWVDDRHSMKESLEAIARGNVKLGRHKSVTVDIDAAGLQAGNVKIIFSLSALRREVADSVRSWIGAGAAFVLLGIAGAFLISARVTRPIERVVKAMTQVEAGNFHQKVETRGRDEISMMSNTFNKMVDGLKEREFIKDTFSKYISKQVADKILKERDYEKLKGERRIVTVLFADMRGFTTMSSSLQPQEIMDMLNEYFSSMVDIVFKYGGMLDKFIGDAIMAVYNAPLEQKYHELRAVMTALEIQESVTRINRERSRSSKLQIAMGIGVNTGEAVAGNVGSAQRLEYTVIGSGVNLAQRIESCTKKGQLLISHSTYERIADYVDVVEHDPVTVKGVPDPVKIYTVLNARWPEDFDEQDSI